MTWAMLLVGVGVLVLGHNLSTPHPAGTEVDTYSGAALGLVCIFVGLVLVTA